MSEILTAIVHNLISIGGGVVLFAICYSGNIVFSTYYNVDVLGDYFKKEKMQKGIRKALVFSIGMCLVTVGITSIPIYASSSNVEIPKEFIEYFNETVIAGMFIVSSCQYIVKTFSTIKKIVSMKNTGGIEHEMSIQPEQENSNAV